MKILGFITLSLLSFGILAAPNWKATEIMKKNELSRKIIQLKAEGKIIIDGGSRKRQEKTNYYSCLQRL
jgi:hypothetical protein